MGEIIKMMDGLYEYELPKMPSDEKDILFYDLPKKHQYWGSPFDKNQVHLVKDVRRMTERQKVEYVNWNREKWLTGVWMFINGEPTYITGMHFDFLKFCKFEDFGRPPDYLDQQRLDFYFRDLVRKDTRCYGKVILKTRRCGMTAEELCEGQYTLLEDFSSKIGLQSNELTKKCLPELMHPLINMYIRRPLFMREEYQKVNGKKPINSLKLTSNKASDEDESYGDDNGFLGGNVMAYPTTPSAMDGSKKRYIIMDEVFKWTNCSAYETLGINKKCVVEYGIKGKIGMLSTMGDSDAVVNAVKEGCRLYAESDPRVRDPNGRTTSGLYKWFVSAIHSADVPEEYRDIQYGKVNEARALEYIWGEINKHPKNSKNYIFELRRLPPEEKFALLSATDANYFDLIRFQSRLDYLNALPKHKKPYVVGRLEENPATGLVEFHPDEAEGKWLFALHPYYSFEKKIDTRNRFRINEQGVMFPPLNPEFFGAYDPIRYKTDDTTSNHLSLAAGVFFKKFDYYGAGDANSFAALYLDRPSDPYIAHGEMRKACKYLGAPLDPERQVESTEKDFDDNNMRPFIVDGTDGKWGTWMNPKVAENGLQLLVTLFSAPKTPEEKDHIESLPWEVAIEDFKHFDLKNTETFHIAMAFIILARFLNRVTPVIISQQTDDQMRNILDLLIPNRSSSGRMQ